METYHLRTSEPERGSILPFGTFGLDSIYIPDKQIIYGITYNNLPTTKGTILNYSFPSDCEKAQKMIDGNDEGIRGDVISITDLKSEIFDKMISFCKRYDANGKGITLREPFDGSTECLIEILSGSLKENLGDKVKRFFQRPKLELQTKL